ncbi:ThiF family adenylyltransferase [Solitalea lacus]|uniref:ThiF family adenylyltransferase n=1 Tax=Solitalea lacus TaxID=2911172 RepID=UPI001EDA450F|nr:ThiF family adenylyltransferase [Solitalea lacus]UKJ08998.1 ThiF family adenylyltransferase [Solitalea lacus]
MNFPYELPQLINQKLHSSQTQNKDYHPVFFRLGHEQDTAQFLTLLSTNPVIKVYDKIFDQLVELMRIRHVGKQQSNIEQIIIEYLAGVPLEEYGVWVYYPWNNKIVHLLDEEEFIEVRTSRNKLKITKEEQDVLKDKCIGVVGLSVGQAIAITIAMERVCGSLRLTDFDTFELSNLNRVRAGVSELGVSKVVYCARQIAEIDPFVKISCFEHGVSADNINEFLGEGDSQIDLLIEVCDSLEMKVIARLAAKNKCMPIVMETNDKGILDIERFDIEPDRELLHGRIEHIEGDLKEIEKQLSSLNPQDRIQFLAKMIGMENISDRMKLSLQQMGKTINSWPQLASAVVVGGGAVTNISRRILLNTLTKSGRYFVDVEEIVA